MFLDLPNDVIVDIMSLLAPDDVARSALVCSRVNKCTQNGWISLLLIFNIYVYMFIHPDVELTYM